MKGKLKSIYDGTIDSDFVSAKDFSRLYEAHEKALDKITAMTVSANNAWDEWCKLSEQNESITKACSGHIDTIGKLQAECGALESQLLKTDHIVKDLVIENVELTEKNKRLSEDLEAANRRNEDLKSALSDWQIYLECK